MDSRELNRRIEGAVEFRTKKDKDFGVEEYEPFYEKVPAGKLKPCQKAIDNLATVQANRPLKPPGRR
jgi:hypothetical protein